MTTNEARKRALTRVKTLRDTGYLADEFFETIEATLQPTSPMTDAEITELWTWSASVEAERTGAPTQQHAFARAILSRATPADQKVGE